MSGRLSIHDVAAEAGVSVATVSRVLTGTRAVRLESQEAVHAAVAKLGYRPNQLGRALRRQETQVVGMLVPRVDNPFFPSVVQACEAYLRRQGYALLLSTSDDDPDIERQRIEMLVDRQVDGLLVSPSRWSRSSAAIASVQRLVPLVQLDRISEGWDGDYVGVDDLHGIGLVVDHLRATGRNRLAFVGSNEDTFAGTARHRAFLSLCGAPPHPHWQALGTFSEDWGYVSGLRLLREEPRPDAVVCANDLIAIGVLRAAQELGLSVPQDVAISGYDGIDLARVCRPALTTVAQPVAALSATAIDLLLDRIREPQRPATRRLLPMRLIPRESTSC